MYMEVGLGGLGVTCSPRDPRFAGSNPAEVDGPFQDVKTLSTNLPRGTLSWGVIHVLVLPKFGGAQYISKNSQCTGQQ